MIPLVALAGGLITGFSVGVIAGEYGAYHREEEAKIRDMQSLLERSEFAAVEVHHDVSHVFLWGTVPSQEAMERLRFELQSLFGLADAERLYRTVQVEPVKPSTSDETP